MDELRERFADLDHRLADLDMPDLLSAAEIRAVRTTERVHARHRWSLLALVAVFVLGSGALGWAYFTSSAQDTVSIQCEIAGVSTVIPSVSGNPVADCAAQWRRDTGNAAPQLVAYDNGHGGITVLPADQPPPSGWRALPPGATQNGSMVEMQQWLDDHVSGLNSGCYDNETAVPMTEQALQRLGMTNWTVQPAPRADPRACVDTGIPDPATFTVQLRALDGPPSPDAPFERLAVKLRSIAAGCILIDAAVRQVRAAAAEVGLSQEAHEYQLTEVTDPTARCTTIYENVGGSVFVILRGPSS
jgi:hypothetical protein